VGFPSNFAPGQVETKFIQQYGVWIVNYEYNGQPEIYALRSVCTHLGCTPNWLEGEQKFKCPCHGSGFYKDGINFEGPAPRPLALPCDSHRRRRPIGSRQERALSGNRPVEQSCFIRRSLIPEPVGPAGEVLR
jgi:nitrite reductase/ring-hydroxylating ferredoxin subunit